MKDHHHIGDLIQVLSINTATFLASMFTNIETVLKIILLLVSIGYTCYKWIKDIRDKK